MKGKSVALDLMHLQTGHHREFNVWHDYDHQPEVVATVPNVFIAQFWVAPPAYVEARPPSDLPFDGGEYVNIYWSEGSPEDLVNSFYLKGKELRPRGRMTPARFMDRVWSSRLRVLSGKPGAGEELSAAAVAYAPDAGLVVSVEQVIDPNPSSAYPFTSQAVHDYEHWVETELTPALLESGLLRAIFSFVPQASEDQSVYVRTYYTRETDPLASFIEFQRIADDWRRKASPGLGIGSIRREVFLGVYRRVMPGQYDSYA